MVKLTTGYMDRPFIRTKSSSSKKRILFFKQMHNNNNNNNDNNNRKKKKKKSSVLDHISLASFQRRQLPPDTLCSSECACLHAKAFLKELLNQNLLQAPTSTTAHEDTT
ncbi:hypothetical protein HELRODRAFT_184242 [Helobdella robusta]|uniref:Uncharacterized protein n=1 Tax=Helobdella robusta TaxID=6412 RepID=T1FKU2_HELRO|nr:hypothetical protein HELRODRAFT_184242 [Helobdella robusta]ESO04484.1 hypothetical protein HELRODRAFT_184242 [Helobdella robusta]